MRGIRSAATVGLFLVTLLATLLAYGCDGGRSMTGGGVQVLTPTLVARSDSSVEFSRVTGIGVDSRDQIFAGDGLGEILVLDQNGKFRMRFGRMGGGPGEYQSLGGVYLTNADTLFVFDPVALRATIYAPSSNRVAYTVRLPEPNLSFPMEIAPLGTGTLIGHFRRINGDVPGSDQRRDDLIRILNGDGSIRDDSILTIPEPEVVEVKSAQGQGFFLPAFARHTLVRWDSQGRIYTVWTDSARVQVHGPDGRLMNAFDTDLGRDRLPVSDATIDSIAERSASQGLSRRMIAEAFRSRWKTWPLVEDMLVDDQSRIWIKPVTHDSVGDWFAFTPRGQRVASFRLPRSVTLRLIRGDRLYGVSKDSLDVESVVVYRLTPSSARTPERP